MAINSNKKGSRYERKAVKLLEGLGYEARRSQQYQGVAVEGAGDLQTNLDGKVRFEVKGGYNDTNLTSAQTKKWVQTAREETPEGTEWVLLWQKSRMDWVALVDWHGDSYLAFTDVQAAINFALEVRKQK